ncbi:MAG: hypothetical protein HY722_02830 [Planctomycetes bacterium]|nr:hypothetical protein [Planctomycetota bacterium]
MVQLEGDAEVIHLLRAGGLTTMPSLFDPALGQVLRRVVGRENVRVVVADRTLYFKRQADYLARHEWEAIRAVRRGGVPVPSTAAAWGETGSVLISLAPRGASPLEDVRPTSLAPYRRRDLVRRVAELARRFHETGWVHKDLNLAHLIGGPHAGDLWLIDFARAQPRGRVMDLRWRVKDLASLLYSARQGGWSAADVLRFLRTYTGRDEECARRRWTTGERGLMKWVQAKAARIAWHEARVRSRVLPLLGAR